MDLLLVEEAGRAQDIADIFSVIRSNDEDNVRDLTVAITALNHLSCALRELNQQIDAVGNKLSRPFADDLTLLQNSVAFTLQDLWTICGKIPPDALAVDYRLAWREVCRYCTNMGKQPLHLRLETYQLFAYALCKQLKRQLYSQRQFDDLRHEISDLQTLLREEHRLLSAADTFANLSLARVPKGQRTPEKQLNSVCGLTLEQSSSDRLQHQPVPSPPPLAPVTTFFVSPASPTSSVDTGMSQVHWAPTIFNNLPSTTLQDDPNPSRCYGDVTGRAHRYPDADFDSILQLKFPGGLRVKFFWRAHDYRSKLVCEWPDSRRQMRWSCFPLSDLHIRRSGPFLFLCCPTVQAANTCWASLKFTSYEWLVVFHCTFLSMRSHDTSSHVGANIDHDLKGEKSSFAGAIRDSGYKHALRLYRDKSTDAIRLEASVLEGEMRDTPIWTAFITYKITSPTWFRWTNGSSTVYLAELQRHVFSSKYIPHIAANGEHPLDFDLTSDAEDFVRTLVDFGADLRQPKTVQ